MIEISKQLTAAARAVAFAGLVVAASAVGAAQRFDLQIDGGPAVSFQLDEPAVPSWSSEGGFRLSGISATFADAGGDPVAAGASLFFYIGDYGGGLDLSSSRGDEYGFFGPQLFSGDNAAPLFTSGFYSLEGASLTITNIMPVAEPGEWAMLCTGLGLVAFAARRRRAYSAAASTIGSPHSLAR